MSHPLLASTCGDDVPAPNAALTQTVSFRADSVRELFGQLVGVCSSTRFWDEMETRYPYGAGVFQEDVAGRLIDAAMAEYTRLADASDGMPDAG